VKPVSVIAVILALGTSVGESFAQTKPGAWVGYFVGGSGPVAFIEVDIFPAYEGQAFFIDFMLKQAAGDRTVGAVASVTNATDRQFAFEFTDNEGNAGRGTFSRVGDRYTINLRSIGARSLETRAPDLYGDYVLTRRAAVGRSDRHPWSWKTPLTRSK
jgi:hypothetical protein